MTTRIPAIVQQVLANHELRYPAEIRRSLEELHDELVENTPIRPLATEASDGALWADAWQSVQGRRWLDVPWFFAESFFYRRLLEACGYFGGHGDHTGPWRGVDPFWPRKQVELQSDTPWQVLATALQHATNNSAGSLRTLLHHTVWGNRVDLSYNQVAEATGRDIAIEREQANLLIDDTEAVINHLNDHAEPRGASTLTAQAKVSAQKSAPSVHFICDNTGTELLMDLALADFLLRFGRVRQITLHVKAQPTFVSDAVPFDIEATIAAIQSRESEIISNLAIRLREFKATGYLRVQAHPFWNSHHFFWELPPDLVGELAQARLVIVKGDANYRQLLGDSRWPTTVPIIDAVPYFPTALVCLRTMKSDPVVGLQPGQAEILEREDPEWRVNGKRGLIQALL